jgi:hypothetical protein
LSLLFHQYGTVHDVVVVEVRKTIVLYGTGPITTCPPLIRKKPPQNSFMLGRATGCEVMVTVALHVLVPVVPVTVMV